MHKIYSVLVIAFLLFSCDDGDIITADIEFGNTFKTCGDLLFYKTKAAPNESLSLYINTTTTIDDLLETVEDPNDPYRVILVNETVSLPAGLFNYRIYNNDPTSADLFCSNISPSDINIVTDYVANGVSSEFSISFIEDDNDGIPAAEEDDNNDGDNDHTTNPLDTDGDGIPDYLDDDDDGDNVKTIAENHNYTTADGFTNAQDTDGDGTPDYLDNDDDGDMVLTINEENDSTDLDPTNDISNSNSGPDYLNEDIATTVIATAYSEHIITQNFQVGLILSNINLSILTQDVLDFGILDSPNTTKTRTVTPTF